MMTEQTQGCQGSDTLNSKQQASYDDTLSMSMTTRAAWLSVLLASALVTGCASGGAVPRPLPFPGANPPPASPDDSRPDSTVSVPPAGLLATALALRGTPYLNGGSEPSRGFDCSGFVQWVFAQHGASLPRETREQYGEGDRIDQDEVQPGDLVFFRTVSRGASHVGIALGNGEFVHAPSSRGVVRVERYTSGYWSSRWVGARRVGTSLVQ
jgi:cell wall-associated NlpC family hydrolase